jgi:hypothetical protein
VFAAMLLICGPASALDSYDFGDVEFGGDPASVTLDIENLNPGTLGLTLESGGANGFSLPATEVTVPANGIGQVQVVFSPIAEGPATDTLNVTYMGFAVLQKVSLSGNGIEKQASTEPDSAEPMAALEKWTAAVAYKYYNGTLIGDRLQECMADADNYGQAVRCVAYLAAELRKERAITRHDAREMRAFACKSRFLKQKKLHKHMDRIRERKLQHISYMKQSRSHSDRWGWRHHRR